MSISDRLGCSSISFRHLTLADALLTIRDLGFVEIDLGALPGVCDHVPFAVSAADVDKVAGLIETSGLRVRSVNGDIGALNHVLDPPARSARLEHLERLLRLTRAVGAVALVLPNGASSHEPVRDLDSDLDLVAAELTDAAGRAADVGLELWVETLHILRLCHTPERARQLTERLAPAIGVVMDVSHITAAGASPVDFVASFAPRIRHVHLRDASPGNIHHSIGNGEVDFAGTVAALERGSYEGHFTLELETRDLGDADRPTATARAATFISALLPPAAGAVRTTQAPASFAGRTPSGGTP